MKVYLIQHKWGWNSYWCSYKKTWVTDWLMADRYSENEKIIAEALATTVGGEVIEKMIG